jgi:catechol 2,3-dioxygenase-like lactoylglutathione lyase family enzyme
MSNIPIFTPTPFVYVRDMRTSLAFYQALGFTVRHTSDEWSELLIDNAILALHLSPPSANPNQASQMGLALRANRPLEYLYQQWDDAGIEIIGGIQVQPFGRSFTVRDPDGVLIQVNEKW